MKKVIKKGFHFLKLIKKLITGVPFITLSLLGNIIVLIFSTIIYFAEKGPNSSINSFSDALWYSFSTATTVGYGDVTPKSLLGRAIGVFLMLIGVALFGIYTSLFARAIIDDEKYMD